MDTVLWTLLGLALAAIAIGVVRRIAWPRKREDAKEPANVYPLW